MVEVRGSSPCVPTPLRLSRGEAFSALVTQGLVTIEVDGPEVRAAVPGALPLAVARRRRLSH